MTDSWSKIEVALIVADYFDMLIKELNRIPYKKAAHRRQILPLLNNRSEGSIEFKHQNISAILINLGRPYITGYLPRYNYQNLLEDEVIDYLIHHSEIETDFRQFVEKEIIKPQTRLDFERIIVTPPEIVTVTESNSLYQHKPPKINYLEKEQSNKALGLYGEEIVIEYEKWNLLRLGKDNLADKIKWISKEEGDGAGFDILSKNLNGTDKYIEVKTTRLGKETPFFFSSNELQFSIKRASDYHLYRLFNAENDAKLFQKNGSLNSICKSVPTMFKGYF
ncbi:MAG: hypothetical protein BWY47_00770 [Bacteroidetes bacterium ADurb.Bin302]|nr:MAG: hypothetical protein BWY47_00770 [Bacteroidetes bacterium ADurb.Bin302]